MGKSKAFLSAVIVLCSICLMLSLILSITYLATKERIEENQQKKEEEERKDLLPLADRFIEPVDVHLEEGVIELWQAENEEGWVVTCQATGFQSTISVMTGIDSLGKITGVKIKDISEETPGIVKRLLQNTYLNQYKGASGITTVKESVNPKTISAVSGATYSSEAIFSCVNLALMQIQNIINGSEL